MSAGVVLCGGRSSRMGRAKALLPWTDGTMVGHVVRTLRGVVDEVVVVSTAELALPALDARVVCDPTPHLGPLAGIAAGLAAIHSDAAFVTATDTPLLDPALVGALLSRGPTHAVKTGRHVEPLAAVYPRGAAARASELLTAGERRPLRLLEALDYRALAADELPGGGSVESLDTPDQYLAALRRALPDAEARVEFLGACRARAGVRERAVPVGTLGEVLQQAAPELDLVEDDRLSRHILVSIEARRFVRDPALPVGAGERVVVLDASAGG